MRKNILALSIAAMVGGLGLAGGASAAVFTNGAATELRTDNTGIGHILAIPYFTTQAGNATLISITNTNIGSTAAAKAVKVRFRGASNSDDIFDFQLLLSPGDVWTATITQGADGLSVLRTTDKSCTIPAGVGSATPALNTFVTARLPSSFTDAQKAVETREGYIEILNMADIPNALQPGQLTPVAPASPTVNPLWAAVKHVAGVAPCTAGPINALNTDSLTRVSASPAGTAGAVGERAASTLGLTNPTGGLFANYTIINVAKTLVFSGEAVAVRATDNLGVNQTGHLVYSPQMSTAVGSTAIAANQAVFGNPAAGVAAAVAGNNALLSADPLFQTAGVTDASVPAVAPVGLPRIPVLAYDLPDLSTPYTTAAATALAQSTSLTRAFAATAVINETLGDTGIAAFTDWVFSMPTRRYHVAMDYNHVATVGNPDGRLFTTYAAADTFFSLANTSVFAKQICVAADSLATYDREETTSSSGAVISPGQVTTLSFCGEASVLSFNAGGNVAASVLSSTVARKDVTTAALDGWTRINIPGLGAPANGLPVIGKAFMKAFNGAAGAGVSGNFGIASEHRYIRP